MSPRMPADFPTCSHDKSWVERCEPCGREIPKRHASSNEMLSRLVVLERKVFSEDESVDAACGPALKGWLHQALTQQTREQELKLIALSTENRMLRADFDRIGNPTPTPFETPFGKFAAERVHQAHVDRRTKIFLEWQEQQEKIVKERDKLSEAAFEARRCVAEAMNHLTALMKPTST